MKASVIHPSPDIKPVSIKSIPTTTSFEECSIIFGMFVKIAASGVLLFLPTAISYSFIGHYSNSTRLMAGAGLGRIFANVTALSFAWGITLGLQTLVPQALGHHNESQSKYLLALYTQQCLFVSIIGLIPLSVLQFYSGTIICAIIHQSHDLCTIISSYCRCLIPFLWLTNALMIVQRVSRPLMYNTELMLIFAICAILNFCINYIFVDILHYNYLWTALSVDLTQLITLTLIVFMLCYKGHSYIFRVLSLREILKWNGGIKIYLKLSIPGLIQTASSWWITELVVLFCGFITVDVATALTATAIATQVNSFGRVITIGLCAPVAIRVGYYIGASNIYKAQQSAKIAFVYIDIVLLITLFSILFFARDKIPTIWSNDPNVVNLCSDLLIIGGIFQIPYNVFYFIGCVYRGLGFPEYAAIFLAISQYFIGVPFQILTLFHFKWRNKVVLGSMSIWSVVTCGYVLAVVLLLIHMKYFVSWDKAVCNSEKRIKKIMQPNVNYGSINNDSN